MGGLGFMKSVMSGTAGLSILVVSYSMFSPFMNYLVDFTITLGAPAGNAFFLAKLFMWTFVIMGVCLLLIPLLAAYMETYDTGQEATQSYYYYRRRIR